MLLEAMENSVNSNVQIQKKKSRGNRGLFAIRK